MNSTDISKLEVGGYYWLRFVIEKEIGEDVFIGQYTEFFGKGFYVMGMSEHVPFSEFIVLGKVSTKIINMEIE